MLGARGGRPSPEKRCCCEERVRNGEEEERCWERLIVYREGVRIFHLIGRGRLEARGLTLEFEDLLFQVLYRLLLG